MGYFYGSNIHPYTECLKRKNTLLDYAAKIGLRLIVCEAYDLEHFLRKVVYREKDRCLFCYQERLRSTAIMAKRGKFDAFSTTLLYSKFQRHETIRSIGHAVEQDVGVAFVYNDFRTGWKEGIDTSKTLNMYRQQYCGCIYSEKERYFKR
jgi:predicted adenine nucleotide alpha hydrolase (AANH) superfamily ATPase